MKLTTKILIIAVVLLSIALGLFYHQWQNNKDRADRMSINYNDVVKENFDLNLKYSELNEFQKKRIDRLTDSLKIKTKKVKEYVYVNITDTIHDTIRIELTLIEPFTYKFSKDTACFSIEGLINNKNDIPELQFTQLEYSNNVEYLIYCQRKKWEFWFIKSRLFGKKENQLEVISKCGTSTVQKINLIKK